MASLPLNVEFKHFVSSKIFLHSRIKIDKLAIRPILNKNGGLPGELHLSIQLWDAGSPIHSLPKSTRAVYNPSDVTYFPPEWIILPVKYHDLSSNATLVITIFAEDTPIARIVDKLFTENKVLKTGVQKLKIQYYEDNKTLKDTENKNNNKRQNEDDDSLRLIRLRELYQRKEIPRLDWLDKKAMERISFIEASDDSNIHSLVSSGCITAREEHLVVTYPHFDQPVIYEEQYYSEFIQTMRRVSDDWWENIDPETGNKLFINTKTNVTRTTFPSDIPEGSRSRIAVVYDPETDKKNPSQQKYIKLERVNYRARDPNLKPDVGERQKLTKIIDSPIPINGLSEESKNLLFKFGHTSFLTGNKKALTRFLYCIDWNMQDEVNQVVDLLQTWVTIDIDDALLLLSDDFKNEAVRKLGVSMLSHADDDELQCYLLQLVQALRYESELQKSEGDENESDNSLKKLETSLGPLANFLIERACHAQNLSCYLYWYLKVATEDKKFGSQFNKVLDGFMLKLKTSPEGEVFYNDIQNQIYILKQCYAAGDYAKAVGGKVAKKTERLREVLSPGGEMGELCFLKNSIPLPQRPDLRIKGIVPESAFMLKSALCPFVLEFKLEKPEIGDALGKGGDGRGSDATPEGGGGVGGVLDDIGAMVRRRTNSTTSRLDRCTVKGCEAKFYRCNCKKCSICGHDISGGANSRERHHCRDCGTPVCPNCWIKDDGVKRKVCKDSKSCQRRMNPTEKVMFKVGDDLRQDQLIIQMVSLMDRLLMRVHLDLKLTPYSVLATGTSNGLMEFVVNSHAVSGIGDFQAFFKKHHPHPSAPYGIEPEVLDTFIRSCAGYSVVTYLLGIGDRHLDNIMIKTSGNLFHIDFGYIFGRDPKWNPPPIRITNEMVEGMGGAASANFKRFKSYCGQAYNIIRKSANLILNLLKLMLDSGINDLGPSVLLVVQDKFKLELNDEEAERFFQMLIDQCVSAILPEIFEFGHRIAVSLK